MYKVGKKYICKDPSGEWTFKVTKIRGNEITISYGNGKSCTCGAGELDLARPKMLQEEEIDEGALGRVVSKTINGVKNAANDMTYYQQMDKEAENYKDLSDNYKKLADQLKNHKPAATSEDVTDSGSVANGVKVDYIKHAVDPLPKKRINEELMKSFGAYMDRVDVNEEVYVTYNSKSKIAEIVTEECSRQMRVTNSDWEMFWEEVVDRLEDMLCEK